MVDLTAMRGKGKLYFVSRLASAKAYSSDWPRLGRRVKMAGTLPATSESCGHKVVGASPE